MARFAVTTMVTFYGEVEADTPEEAESAGWDWEGEDLTYDSVYSIEVEELEKEDESEDE